MSNEDIILNRISKLKQELNARGIDAMLITKKENFTYMSGFTGSSATLVITVGNVYLITDARYVEQAYYESPEYEIVQHFSVDFMDKLRDILNKNKVKKLGFESKHITYARFMEYKENLDFIELIPTENIIEYHRVIKDEKELEYISRAVKIADDAFAHILKYIKPGISEIDIKTELEFFIKKNGASDVAFETIVVSGTRSSLVHGIATDKKLEYGDNILLDYGAVYKGYRSDISRTVFLGHISNELKSIYNIVLNAQKHAIENLMVGLTGRDVDALARNIIEECDWGENFGHGLGHGVGLEIHELPVLNKLSEYVLSPNMVVTIEPGIYVMEKYGVRVEDCVVVTNDGAHVLTQSDKNIVIL